MHSWILITLTILSEVARTTRCDFRPTAMAGVAHFKRCPETNPDGANSAGAVVRDIVAAMRIKQDDRDGVGESY